MGDALAVCLLELRNFSSEDFAKYHPGGSLGKQLYLKVSDVFVNNLIPIVKPDAPLKDVILEISSKRLGCTAVAESDQKLLGIITDGDLRRMLQKNVNITEVKAGEIMTKNPRQIEKDEFAVKALHMMQEKSITQLVVVEGNRVVGFIHLHDLLKEGIV